MAVEILKTSSISPDAMLVDFRLSDEITGLEAIEVVKAHLGFSIPALIITGDTTDSGLNEITSSGYQHLHKPVESEQLLRMVKDATNSPADKRVADAGSSIRPAHS